jgi:hypothetical protein
MGGLQSQQGKDDTPAKAEDSPEDNVTRGGSEDERKPQKVLKMHENRQLNRPKYRRRVLDVVALLPRASAQSDSRTT